MGLRDLLKVGLKTAKLEVAPQVAERLDGVARRLETEMVDGLRKMKDEGQEILSSLKGKASQEKKAFSSLVSSRIWQVNDLVEKGKVKLEDHGKGVVNYLKEEVKEKTEEFHREVNEASDQVKEYLDDKLVLVETAIEKGKTELAEQKGQLVETVIDHAIDKFLDNFWTYVGKIVAKVWQRILKKVGLTK